MIFFKQFFLSILLREIFIILKDLSSFSNLFLNLLKKK